MATIERTRTWILIGNAARARVFSKAGDRGRYRLWRELEHPESRAKNRELVTDDRGRVRQSDSGARPAMEPRTSPKEHEADKFALSLARLLKEGLDRGAYDRLVLILPPRFLGLLRRHLSKHVAARVATVLAKDLTAHDPSDIDLAA